MNETPRLAHVYKSLRKADTYVFLREKEAFTLIPDAVRAPLGPLQWVMDVVLRADKPLARADVAVVMRNLESRGFYLQAPPSVLDPLVAGGVGDG